MTTLTWTPLLMIGGAALAAAGIGAALAAWLFPSRPHLRAALGRIHHPEATTWSDRAVAAAAARLRLPAADLALLDRTAAQHLTGLAVSAAVGAALPPVCAAILATVGWDLPWGANLALALALAAVCAWSFHYDAHRKAEAARAEFTRCLAVYIDLVGGELAAGRGHVQALEAAARVCTPWPFERISAALDRAGAQMRLPWTELRELAARIDTPDLADLAKILASADAQGTDVTDSLADTSQALRDRLTAADLADAKSINARVGAPGACMLLIITVLALYPLMSRLTI